MFTGQINLYPSDYGEIPTISNWVTIYNTQKENILSNNFVYNDGKLYYTWHNKPNDYTIGTLSYV